MRQNFDKKVTHPLQSWAWGELRKSKRIKIIRLKEGFQISFHKIPKLPWTIGYCPKSKIPTATNLKAIFKEAIKQKAIMVKFEPNIVANKTSLNKIYQLKNNFFLVKGRPLFTKFTFWLDLTKPEEELMKAMKSKTRYNIRLARKKGVKIIEDSTLKGFQDYWKLMKETTRRQSFYAHNKAYHLKMWQTMKKSGQAHLLKAIYKKEVLSAWIVFIFNGVLYYPYGASSRKHRELMANNLLAWEVIKFGKNKKCKLFDMWGSLGPNPDQNDPWYGFHKFKEGYGGELIEFVGSWDLVIHPILYFLYRMGEIVRWAILRWRT